MTIDELRAISFLLVLTGAYLGGVLLLESLLGWLLHKRLGVYIAVVVGTVVWMAYLTS